MSNDAQKADQIAFHFYTKLFHVVNEARATVETRNQSRVDKWFNLETPDSDLFTKEARDRYKSISASPSPPPPLEVQVLLTVPDVNNNQVLVHIAPDSSRLQLRPTPKQILLENWVLAFTPRDTAADEDVSLPKIYKHGIPLFRSLYSLLRILPTWKLCKRLRRRIGSNANLTIQLGINQDDSGILGFESPPAPNTAPLQTQTHTFPAVPHPMGTLSLTATYLTAPTFRLDDLESLLSSRFLSEGPEFVPTLVKNQQRDSITGSSPLVGSLPTRTSLPTSRSPPSSITVAERFILPHRTASTAGLSTGKPSISPRNVPMPLPRPTSGEPGSASTSSREDPVARLRRESTSLTRSGTASGIVTGPIPTSGSSSDLPGAPLPIPLRRPNINPVHPFKTNALASTSSLVSNSPKQPQSQQQGLSSSPLSLHSLPPSSSSLRGITTSTPPQVSTTSITRFPTVGPPSPIGIGMTKASPSSLGDRRSLVGTDGGTGSADSGGGVMPSRKRYSSSFGHRYTASGGAASDGERSTGSGSASATAAAGGGERAASFLGTNTDDDDISEFVQDIDRRVPLTGGGRRRRILLLQSEGAERREVDLSLPSPSPMHERERTLTADEPPLTPLLFSPDRESPELGTGIGLGGASRSRFGGGGTRILSSLGVDTLSTSPPAGTIPMLTSEDEVDEKLRKMNEAFLKSLEGFSGTSSRSRSRSEGEGRGRGSVRSRRERERDEGEGSREGPVTTGQVAAMMLRDRQDSPSLSRRGSRLGLLGGGRDRDLMLEGGSSGGSGNVSANASIMGQGSEEVIGRLEFASEELRGLKRTTRR